MRDRWTAVGEHERDHSCGGKRRFVSMAEARAAVRAAQRRARKKERLTAYHCRFCGGFHYGHAPDRLR